MPPPHPPTMLLVLTLAAVLCSAQAATTCTSKQVTAMTTCVDAVTMPDGTGTAAELLAKACKYQTTIADCYPTCACDGDEGLAFDTAVADCDPKPVCGSAASLLASRLLVLAAPLLLLLAPQASTLALA